MLITKNVNDIVNSIIDNLVNQGLVPSSSSIHDGSILKTLIEAIALELVEIYKKADYIDENARLSTASGVYLDRIGELFGVIRTENEPDSIYRMRIIEKVTAQKTSSKSYILSELKNINNIGFLDIVEHSYGPGTFTLYYRPNEPENDYQVRNDISKKLTEIVPVGVYYKIVHPEVINISINLVVTGEYDENLVQKAVKDYINNIPTGGTLYTGKIVNAAMDINGVKNCFIHSIELDGETLYANEITLDKYNVFSVKTINILK